MSQFSNALQSTAQRALASSLLVTSFLSQQTSTDQTLFKIKVCPLTPAMKASVEDRVAYFNLAACAALEKKLNGNRTARAREEEDGVPKGRVIPIFCVSFIGDEATVKFDARSFRTAIAELPEANLKFQSVRRFLTSRGLRQDLIEDYGHDILRECLSIQESKVFTSQMAPVRPAPRGVGRS